METFIQNKKVFYATMQIRYQGKMLPCHHTSAVKYIIATFKCVVKFDITYIQVSQKWRTNYLLPYPGCLNVHEKNMETIFQTKK
jgi:hypothetical protein